MIQKKKGRAEYSPGRLGSLDPELTELSSVAERTSTVKNRKTKEETGLCGTGGLSNGCRRKRKDRSCRACSSHTRKYEFPSESKGAPFKEFKQGSNLISSALQKSLSGCWEENI